MQRLTFYLHKQITFALRKALDVYTEAKAREPGHRDIPQADQRNPQRSESRTAPVDRHPTTVTAHRNTGLNFIEYDSQSKSSASLLVVAFQEWKTLGL
jgi:hypothetical protein